MITWEAASVYCSVNAASILLKREFIKLNKDALEEFLKNNKEEIEKAERLGKYLVAELN